MLSKYSHSRESYRNYLNQSLRLKIFNRDSGICQICGKQTRFNNSLTDSPFNKSPVAGSVDHIFPVSKGGTNDENNLRWTCRSCNCSKGSKL